LTLSNRSTTSPQLHSSGDLVEFERTAVVLEQQSTVVPDNLYIDKAVRAGCIKRFL
jgi:hypothetical protein